MTIVLAGMTVFPPELVRYMDGKVYDLLLQALPKTPSSPKVVIVGIDDQSLNTYGQWPWPRYRLARLINKIHELGADTIGLDLIMAEPDSNSLPVILNQWSQETGNEINSSLMLYPDNDQILADTIAEVPIVLGYKFVFDSSKQPNGESCLWPLQSIVHRAPMAGRSLLPTAQGTVCNLPMLNLATPVKGFLNAKTDNDGVLRRLPLVIEYKTDLYPSLALACLMLAEKDNKVVVNSGIDGISLAWNGREIPLDENGFMLVNYRGGKKTFPYFSAGDVLADRIAPKSLQGKIVIIGAWASGLVDWHLSPLDKRFPGPEVHANVIDNILNANFIHRPHWGYGAELFLVVVFGMTTTLMLVYGSAAVNFGLTGLIGLSGWYFFQWLFYTQQIFLSPIMPLATIFVNFALLGILKYGLEEHKVMTRTRELLQAQDATIISLAALAEARDEETGRHLFRTQRYVQSLARRLAQLGGGYGHLDEEYIDLLFKSAPLHDIGKVGIPDHILLKPGKLTKEEYDCMKQHPLIGGKVLEKASQILGHNNGIPYLQLAREMVETHHERWDGSGYPRGLKDQEIPLSGRLMALADVYDALTSRRIYKRVISHEEAIAIIVANKGKQFDPDVVEAFLQEQETFRRIAKEYADTGNSFGWSRGPNNPVGSR